MTTVEFSSLTDCNTSGKIATRVLSDWLSSQEVKHGSVVCIDALCSDVE